MNKANILNLFKYCDFNELSEGNYECLLLDNLPLNWESQFNAACGISKAVLIPKDEKYVIKIPFKGAINSYSRTDSSWFGGSSSFSASSSYYSDYESTDKYREFSGGGSGCYTSTGRPQDNCWDYCLAEALTYRLAKRAKVNYAFAKTKFLGYINEHPIYIQEKCTMFSEQHPQLENSYTKQRTSSVRQYCLNKNYYSFNDVWLTDAYEYYGKNKFDKILNFIKDIELTDLHYGNLGYIGSRPVFVDYSDFNL
jgi:hypothetical protein